MLPIQLKTRFGDDGVLVLRIPIGLEAAGLKVLVTIEPVTESEADDVEDRAPFE
jgi:hypothetical protein